VSYNVTVIFFISHTVRRGERKGGNFDFSANK